MRSAAHPAWSLSGRWKSRGRTPPEQTLPDFLGRAEALDAVLDAMPEVISHNVETVARLYPRVRPQARYERSLGVLRRIARDSRGIVCKTGIMLGLGETKDEVLEMMRDIVAQGTAVLTIGQYVRPSPLHLPLEPYWTPDEFAELRGLGLGMGYRHVESGPLVRSSYRAERHVGA